jgi:hypothetical protein
MWQFGEKWIQKELVRAGVNPDAVPYFQDISRVVASPLDTAMVLRRWEYTEEDINEWLQRLAVHPLFIDIINEASRYYPPVQDLITMAVREVWHPETRARFGQDLDFPEDFLLAAKRAGLSEEWARDYWAAHWDLPSVQQAFEMMHRGVLDMYDLNLLLKAKDIMPFWREKLLQISYNLPGRVDVRRMYRIGVYNLEQVYRDYLAQGFNEYHAEALTNYTHLQTLREQTGLNETQVYKNYVDGFITQEECVSMLSALGLPNDLIQMGMGYALYRRSIQFAKTKISIEKDYFMRGERTAEQVYSNLILIGIASDRAELYKDEWTIEREKKLSTHLRQLPGSKALRYTQVMAGYKHNLISRDDALQNLIWQGYYENDAELLLKIVDKEKEKEE